MVLFDLQKYANQLRQIEILSLHHEGLVKGDTIKLSEEDDEYIVKLFDFPLVSIEKANDDSGKRRSTPLVFKSERGHDLRHILKTGDGVIVHGDVFCVGGFALSYIADVNPKTNQLKFLPNRANEEDLETLFEVPQEVVERILYVQGTSALSYFPHDARLRLNLPIEDPVFDALFSTAQKQIMQAREVFECTYIYPTMQLRIKHTNLAIDIVVEDPLILLSADITNLTSALKNKIYDPKQLDEKGNEAIKALALAQNFFLTATEKFHIDKPDTAIDEPLYDRTFTVIHSDSSTFPSIIETLASKHKLPLEDDTATVKNKVTFTLRGTQHFLNKMTKDIGKYFNKVNYVDKNVQEQVGGKLWIRRHRRI